MTDDALREAISREVFAGIIDPQNKDTVVQSCLIADAIISVIRVRANNEPLRRAALNAPQIIRQMRADLAYYDFLLPGDYVPDPPWRKRWFRWGPAFTVTNDMLVWAGDIARARTLMDLEAAASAIEAPSGVETGNTDSTEGESAVGEAETPNDTGNDHPSNPQGRR